MATMFPSEVEPFTILGEGRLYRFLRQAARRLAYVAPTRTRLRLTLACCGSGGLILLLKN